MATKTENSGAERGTLEVKNETVTEKPKLRDYDVIENCKKCAETGALFLKLYNGDFSDYKDNTEGFNVLCGMISQQTNDIEQVKRIAGNSTLFASMSGETEKKEVIFDMDSTSGRNLAYHMLAREYMDKHHVKYICGGLREYDNGIYPISEESEIFIKRDILKLALERHKTCIADTHVNGAIKVINMLSAVKREECEPDINNVIVVNNGILNLKTFELEPFDENKVYFTKSHVNYDPLAKEPVLFKNFIEMAFKGNDSQKKLIQEIAGYCLCDNYKYQNIFYLLGDGGNGKGTFTQVLTALIGAKNTTAYSLYQLSDHKNVDYFIAGLHGKRANICGDVGAKRIDNTENIKKLTSNTDMITGRFPCERAFEFVNHAKIIMAMNKMPKKDAVTTGDKRRDKIVYFINHISETKEDIKGFAQTIIDAGELPGILLWAIEGLKRLEAQQDFTDDRTTDEKGREYDMVSNAMKYFVADCIEEDEGAFLPTILAYKAYNEYRVSRHMPEMSDEEMKNGIRYHCKQAGIKIVEKRVPKAKLLGLPDSDIVGNLGKQVTSFVNIKLVSEDSEEEKEEQTEQEQIREETREMECLDLRGQCSMFLIDNPEYNIATVTAKAAAHALIVKFPNIGLMNGMDRIVETMLNCKRGCRA